MLRRGDRWPLCLPPSCHSQCWPTCVTVQRANGICPELNRRKLNIVNAKPGNPSRNRIPIGIKEQTLIDSIEKSGYPLQGVVANKLLTRAFHVTEEWGYADRDTHDARSLDVAAYHGLGSERAAAVNPCLFLLIECKRSTHPYVFFRTTTHSDISWFPHIADLPHGGGGTLQEKHSAEPTDRPNCFGFQSIGAQ
jgi:hypothetical protein